MNNTSVFDAEEQEYNEEVSCSIVKPYDPNLVDVLPQTISAHSLFDRIENDEIDLMPSFQRKSGLWDITKKSRLIESILIKIPLPIFYFDSREEDKWTIVDGLQRTSTLNEFVLKKSFKLSDLEYLTEYNGFGYDDLPRNMQRRIQECQLLTYCIRKGTPDDVTTSIFKRLNTGGLILSAAEIRNCVYHGMAADLVMRMAELKSFKIATRNKIPEERMADRDLATRYLAFYVQEYQRYDGNMDGFLESGLEYIKISNSSSKTQDVLDSFDKAMKICRKLLGDYAFRKKQKKGQYGRLNKSLFECTSSCIGRLQESEQATLINKKDIFWAEYERLFDDNIFYQSVNSATGSKEHVQQRHSIMARLIGRILEE